MLGDGPPCQGPVYPRVVGLLPFALADRIESQHHEALQRQVGGEPLPLGLAFLRVACLQKNAGITAGLDGQVQIGGDVEAGQALENHLLDGVVPGLDAAGNSGIERAVVAGQAADQLQKSLASGLRPALGFGCRVNAGNEAFPVLQLRLGKLVHPAEQGVWLGLLSGDGGKHGKSGAHQGQSLA